MRRRVTRRFTRLQTMYKFLKYRRNDEIKTKKCLNATANFVNLTRTSTVPCILAACLWRFARQSVKDHLSPLYNNSLSPRSRPYPVSPASWSAYVTADTIQIFTIKTRWLWKALGSICYDIGQCYIQDMSWVVSWDNVFLNEFNNALFSEPLAI